MQVAAVVAMLGVMAMGLCMHEWGLAPMAQLQDWWQGVAMAVAMGQR